MLKEVGNVQVVILGLTEMEMLTVALKCVEILMTSDSKIYLYIK